MRRLRYMTGEFARYGTVIRDECVPIDSPYVAVANERGRLHFETLLAATMALGEAD